MTATPLTIDSIELRVVRLPLIRSFETSSSKKSALEHIIVRVQGGDLVGWGESASPSDPYYCEETTETCWHILNTFLAPAVVGRPWSTIDEMIDNYAKVKRNNFAKAGLEMACWDLLAKSQGTSLSHLLGGTRSEIHSGVSLGIERDTDRLFGLIDQYVAEGYKRVKLKIGPGRDVDVISAVRERYPDLALMADANSAYTIADLPMLKRLDRFNLTMIEQPLSHDDILDHAAIQRELETPICLDESIHTVDDARHAIDAGSCRMINIKVSRVGGLRNAKRIHDHAMERGVPVWCGGMHEYGIGRAANVAISSLPNYSVPGDVSGSDKYYAEDITTDPVLARAGAIPVPTGPGLGFEVDLERLERATVRTSVIRPE